jgi:hypothetical protein
MRKMLTLVGLLILALSAEAKLNETLAEAVKAYGMPNTDDGNIVSFKFPTYIMVDILDGDKGYNTCQGTIYIKIGPESFTPDEIKKLDADNFPQQQLHLPKPVEPAFNAPSFQITVTKAWKIDPDFQLFEGTRYNSAMGGNNAIRGYLSPDGVKMCARDLK